MKSIFIILSLSFAILSASSLKTGSHISEFNSYKFETPTGRQMKIPKKTNLIIVAFEKDTGALVNEYLNTKEALFLTKKRHIFIADIHEMPTIITNMFALPKLQKYKHLIYLQYDNKFKKNIPNKSNMITLLYIKDKKIEKISYISTKKEFQKIIENN
jgi:hypothetical protein